MYGSAFSSPVLHEASAAIEQLVVQTRTQLAGVAPDGRTTILWSQEIPAFRGMNILTPTVLDDYHLYQQLRRQEPPAARRKIGHAGLLFARPGTIARRATCPRR